MALRKTPSALEIGSAVTRALAEDVGSGDVTAALIDPATRATAEVRCREPAVLCGRAWFDEVFRQVDPGVTVQWQVEDGDDVPADALVCVLEGPARALLSGERTALNFLQTLSGTATTARRYARAVAGTKAQILDTRKTLPGLRDAQKYAVRCGGAENHRHGLHDAYLIKENHIAAAGGIGAAVQRAVDAQRGLLIEVEVENFDELHEALGTPVDRIMLDDFTQEAMRQAVRLRDEHASGTRTPPKQLEASGSVHLDTLRAIADTGVDYISVGAVTKHLHAIDYSMRIR